MKKKTKETYSVRMDFLTHEDASALWTINAGKNAKPLTDFENQKTIEEKIHAFGAFALTFLQDCDIEILCKPERKVFESLKIPKQVREKRKIEKEQVCIDFETGYVGLEDKWEDILSSAINLEHLRKKLKSYTKEEGYRVPKGSLECLEFSFERLQKATSLEMLGFVYLAFGHYNGKNLELLVSDLINLGKLQERLFWIPKLEKVYGYERTKQGGKKGPKNRNKNNEELYEKYKDTTSVVVNAHPTWPKEKAAKEVKKILENQGISVSHETIKIRCKEELAPLGKKNKNKS